MDDSAVLLRMYELLHQRGINFDMRERCPVSEFKK
jgi:hypothetical protein